MAVQDFTDLKLRFARSGSVYSVQEVNGGASASLEVAELQPFLSESVAKSQTGRWTPQDAESSCGQLFEKIFQYAILARFTSARQEALSMGTTLRLWLELEGAEELDDLPWELLANPEAVGGVSLVRSIPSLAPLQDSVPPEALRVLTVVASPTDMPAFDFDWNYGGSKGVSLKRLEEASEVGLRQALEEEHFQILHFVGYGRSNVRAMYGSLFLEGQGRRSRAITAEYLASLLRQRQSAAPRLVMLEAGSSAAELNPFAGTARVLVRNGIDSVVAMRRRLSGLATMTFRQELYSSIASGISIDRSVVNARRALAQRCTDVEWDVPMLYTSSDGGVIQVERPIPAERPSRDMLPVGSPEAATPPSSGGVSAAVISIKAPENDAGRARLDGSVQRLGGARLRKSVGKTRKILILAASPEDLNLLRLGEEIREIEAGLRRARYRGRFRLEQRSAVRPLDLQQAMLDVEPHIVHFCGHGSGATGLILEDDNGHSRPVPSFALANLFRLFADKVECVVLNSCHSEPQARAISEHIDYVVGMKKQIEDRAAIKFAIGFYCALGAGHPIEFAYQVGCSAVELENLPDSLVPVLLERSTSGPA